MKNIDIDLFIYRFCHKTSQKETILFERNFFQNYFKKCFISVFF